MTHADKLANKSDADRSESWTMQRKVPESVGDLFNVVAQAVTTQRRGTIVKKDPRTRTANSLFERAATDKTKGEET